MLNGDFINLKRKPYSNKEMSQDNLSKDTLLYPHSTEWTTIYVQDALLYLDSTGRTTINVQDAFVYPHSTGWINYNIQNTLLFPKSTGWTRINACRIHYFIHTLQLVDHNWCQGCITFDVDVDVDVILIN